MTFSEHLLLLRKQRHLKQTEVADAVGITERGYRNYELGSREPPLSTLIALADFTTCLWTSWSAGKGAPHEDRDPAGKHRLPEGLRAAHG